MARNRTQNADRPMVTLLVERDLLQQIDDFRFRHRFETKTEVMKYLWAKALEQDQPPTDEERARFRLRGG